MKKFKIQRGFIGGIAAVAVIAVLTGVILHFSSISASVVGNDANSRRCATYSLNSQYTAATVTDAEKQQFGNNAKAYSVLVNRGGRDGNFRMVIGATEVSKNGNGGSVKFKIGLTYLGDKYGITNWGGNGDRIILTFSDGVRINLVYNLVNQGKLWTTETTKVISDYSQILINAEFQGKNQDGCVPNILTLNFPAAKPECKTGQAIGDVNGDGTIDTGDSTVIQRILNGTTSAPDDICCADVNGNGKIDADDATQVLNIVVKLAQSPGACPRSVTKVPGAPTAVSAVGGNAQATVSFTAPTNNGGSPITGYTVTSTPGNKTGTGASSPIVVTGLTNGTAYTFTVHATNAVGNSAESATSNSVTPVAAAVPTLTASLTAKPVTGQAPLGVTLAAGVGGTATGTANYTFYCNRADTSPTVVAGYIAKSNGVNVVPNQTVQTNCTYNDAGTYTPRVIVERDGAAPVSVAATVKVTAAATPTPTPVSEGYDIFLKHGFNAIAIPDNIRPVLTKKLQDAGMTVFAFNLTGDKQWSRNPTIEDFHPWRGYYVLNEADDSTIKVDYVSSGYQYYKSLAPGWNLLANSSSTDSLKLSDLKYDLYSTIQSSTAGSTVSCATAGDKTSGTGCVQKNTVSLSDLIKADKGYTKIYVIKDPYATTANDAFEVIQVNDSNIDSVTIPKGLPFWFYLWQ